MSDKRFRFSKTEFDVELGVGRFILDNGKKMTYEGIVNLLNSQDQVIKKQETQIRRLQNQINKLPPKIKEVWLE